MLKKLLLLSLIIVFSYNLVQADGRLIPKDRFDKIIKTQFENAIVNENYVNVQNKSTNNTPSVMSLISNPFTNYFSESDFITSATFTPTTGQSIYDFQSNASTLQLWQNPNNPDKIHAVYMTVDYDGISPNFPSRRSKYYYSADRGVTWSFIVQVPNQVRSGYVCITGTSDGYALVSNHSAAGGGDVRAQVFADIFSGLGEFQRLDPGLGTTSEVIWPRLIATSSITNTNKFVVASSKQSLNVNTDDSSWTNIGTSLSAPGTFTGWTHINATPAECYSLARGDDGRIGIAYLSSVLNINDAGDVYFVESTDDGTTFSTPLQIFDVNFSVDSIGAFRGISLVYQYDKPKVTFDIMWQNPQTNQYRMFWPSKIMFWSSTLPGADPNKSIIIADTSNVWYPQDSIGFPNSANDGFGPLCRPVIGRSSDNNVIFTAFLTLTNRFGGTPDTTNFHAIYLSASGDGGETWKAPVQITPETPVMDWAYPSMTPISDIDANNYYVNMLIQKDTLPGSYLYATNNGKSLAQQMFTRVTISKDSITIGINNIASEIPDDYNLFQNYPNPFNPTTSIRFELPNASNVTLKVYNVRGQLVEVLVNNEKVSAGLKEVEFNATNLASGIYFYTIQAGDFRATKKMILIK